MYTNRVIFVYTNREYMDMHYLAEIRINRSLIQDSNEYPFSVPLIKHLPDIALNSQVTFLIGENGSGKSSLLEAIAIKAGLNGEGGSRNMAFQTSQKASGAQLLADCLTLSWCLKPKNSYFFRAETFFNLATHIDTIAQQDQRIYEYYGDKSLHEQSHGESFISFFSSRLGSQGFFILDEPEVALSLLNQLALMRIMYDVCKNPWSQFIIATHSPILLAYPGATILSCDGGMLHQVAYQETSQYQLTKSFLEAPEPFLARWFNDEI